MITKFLSIPLLLLLMTSCNESRTSESKNVADSNKSVNETNINTLPDSQKSEFKSDTTIAALADSILHLLKNRDYTHFAHFIHPQSGVRFSPYGIVDTAKNKRLSAQELIELTKNKKPIKWGTFEGTGESINLIVDDYFKRFVYDVDFINAEKRSINKVIGADSTSNNIASIYPGSDFVQFYFSGFKKQYQGMDWKSLVLVFSKKDSKRFLVGIIHNQWKI